jgi:hypothetical protein
MMVSRHLWGTWLDSSSTRIREVVGELEGVSEETLERIDHVSRPSGDGPVPRYPEDVMLYERLVLLALTEAQLSSQLSSQGRKQATAPQKKK